MVIGVGNLFSRKREVILKPERPQKQGNPKQQFGRLVRSFRDTHHLRREQLAKAVGKNLKKGFLNAVEHGVCSADGEEYW